MHWQDLLGSFQADAEGFLTRMGDQNPLTDDYAVSVRPSTVQLRRKQILSSSGRTAGAETGVEQGEAYGHKHPPLRLEADFA